MHLVRLNPQTPKPHELGIQQGMSERVVCVSCVGSSYLSCQSVRLENYAIRLMKRDKEVGHIGHTT